MKQNDYTDIDSFLKPSNLANIFNVYEDKSLGSSYLSYNINRTLNILNIDKMSVQAYSEYEVKENDNLATISYKMYGTNRYWWIIAKMNKLYNPLQDLETGMVLKILKNKYINTILEKLKN